MTLRANPDTRRRRTHSQDEDRQQVLVTIGFIVVVILALVAGPTLIRMLDRYARKLHGTFVPLEQT
jgi:hypothetical protein